MTHEQKIFRDALKRVRDRWGRGFDELGSALQQAVVRAEALSVVGQIASIEDSHAGKLATLALQWPLEA